MNGPSESVTADQNRRTLNPMLALAGVLLTVQLLQAPPGELPPRVAALRDAAVKERPDPAMEDSFRNETEKADLYRRLFEAIDPAILRVLTKDPDTSLALQSEWELCRKPIRRAPPVGIYSDWVYDPAPLQTFIAFFEHRVGVAPPSWWTDAVLHMSYDPDEPGHPGTAHQGCWGTTSEHAKRLNATPLAKVDEVGKSLLRVGDGVHTIEVPRGTGWAQGRYLTAVSDKGRFYVAQFWDWAMPFYLSCFDAANGKRVWRRQVWAEDPFGGMGAPFEAPLNIVVHGDEVGVFGGFDAAYAEGFAVGDGSPRFRFSSCYWLNFSEGWRLPWGRPAKVG